MLTEYTPIEDLAPGTVLHAITVDSNGDGWEPADADNLQFCTDAGLESLQDGGKPKHVADQDWVVGIHTVDHMLITLWDALVAADPDNPTLTKLRTSYEVYTTGQVPQRNTHG